MAPGKVTHHKPAITVTQSDHERLSRLAEAHATRIRQSLKNSWQSSTEPVLFRMVRLGSAWSEWAPPSVLPATWVKTAP
jgi:hypothetical protein